jgi:hypothetical protein
MFVAADATACAGFVGSWLLVAGPMLQGALELRAQDIDRESLQRVAKSVPMPPRVSAWWWLVPPVFYALHWRNGAQYRKQMFAAMTAEQREQTRGFLNKATGWFIVAGGAILLASQATWQLVERYALPAWSFWVATFAMLILSTLHTAARMIHAEGEVKPATDRSPQGP